MSIDLATIGVEYDTSGLLKGTAALKQNEQQAGKTADAADKVGGAAKRAGEGFSALSNSLRGLALGLVLREFIQISDQYTKYTAQLKLATQSTQEYARANAEVQRIAKLTEGGLGTIGVLYARITNATRELGISQSQVSKISETVGLSLKVAGATAAESASAMLQLSQSFGAGALRGEEFNAVNEAAPGLLRILAESMGVTQGALKKLAEDGKLTTDVLARAFTDDRVLVGLREQAEQVRTISGAIQLLKDQLVLFVGGQNEATGAGSALAATIGLVAKNLDLLTAAALGYGAAKLSNVILSAADAAITATKTVAAQVAAHNAARTSALASAQAEMARTAALQASLVASQSGLVISREEALSKLASANATIYSSQAQVAAARSAGALSVALALVRDGEKALTAAMAARSAVTAELTLLGQQQARISGQIATANAAHAASEAALTAAKTGGVAASGLAARALGFLGGPIGAITTLLGIGVTAWLAWGGAAKEGADLATSGTESSTREILANLAKQNESLQRRLDLARAGNVEAAKSSSPEAKRLADILNEINVLKARGNSLTSIERLSLIDLEANYANLAAGLKTNVGLQTQLNSIGDQAKAKDWIAKYATDAEKLSAELAKAKKELGSAFTPEIERRIRASFNKGAVADFNNELTEQAKLLAELSGLSPSYIEDLKRLESIRKRGALTEGEYVAAVEALIAKQPSSIALTKELADAEKSRLQGLYAQYEIVRSLSAEYEKSTESLGDQNKALRDEIELIGLNEREQQAIIRARTEATIAVKELELAELQRVSSVTGTQSRIEIALEEEIRLLRERNELRGVKIDRTDAAKAYEDLKAEGKRFHEDLERGLTDSLFRAFESGKGFFRTLWDGIKNLFKTTVLKLAIQGVVTSVLGGSGLAQAGQAVGGLGGIGGLLGELGSAFGSSFGAGVQSTLFGGLEIFNISLEGGMAAIAEGTTTAIASGLGQIAGTIAPYAAAALAAYKIIDSLFGSKGGPKTESTYDTGYSSLNRAGSDPTTARELSDSIEAAYQQLATSLGLAVQDLQVGVFTAIDHAGDALTQLQVVARQNGQEIYNRGARLGGDGTGATPGGIENVGRSEAELQAAIAAEMQQVLLAALQGTDLAAKFKDYLGAATDVGAAVNTVVAVRQLDEAFRRIGGPLGQLTQLSVEAEVAYINQLGGVQALSAALDGYYQNFFSEAERQAATTQRLTEEFGNLGLQMPATRDGLRAIIQAQDLSTESGRRTYAGLLNLSGAFAEVVPAAAAAEEAVQTIVDTATDIARQRQDLLQQEQQAMIELLRASGNAGMVRAMELQGIDASNRAIYERVDALNAELAAQQQANDLLAQGQAMELALYRAMGDTARVRQMELAAMDPSLRALQQLQYELEDLQAAGSGAAAGVRDIAQVLQQRQQLEGQLLQATGNTAELRRRELAALDPANRGLQEHIYAIQDAEAAVQSASQAYDEAQRAAQAHVNAIEQQESAAQSALRTLEQDASKWLTVRDRAQSLLSGISRTLGGPDTREAELNAILNGSGTIDERLQAAEELKNLYEQTATVQNTAAQEALNNAQSMVTLGRQLRDYVQSLRVGDLSALTPAQKLAEAQSQYQQTLAAAQGGDKLAQGRLQGQADAYLRLAREFDPEGYAIGVFGTVTSQLDAFGGTLMSEGEAQTAIQQALLDAAGTGNTLSAEQVAKLTALQGTVQGLLAQAGEGYAGAAAQQAIANAQLSAIGTQLEAARAQTASVNSGVLAAQQNLLAVQQAANTYLANLPAVTAEAIADADQVPGLLQDMPDRIAAALAPLINAASAGSSTAGRMNDIDKLYQEELGRNADASGAQFYANSGLSNADIRAQLNASAEGQVADAYRDVFGREPDAAGSAYYTSQVNQGRPIAEVRADMEYAKAHGAHAEGLNRVPFDGYRAILHANERVLTDDNAARLDSIYDLVEATTLQVPQLPALVPIDMGRFQQPQLDAVVRPLLAELKELRQQVAKLQTATEQGHNGVAKVTAQIGQQVAGAVATAQTNNARAIELAQRRTVGA